MKHLNIEVKGIGFPNKGAELMLCAIQQEFVRRGVSADICVEPYGDYKERAKYRLLQIARVKKAGIDFGKLFHILPDKLLQVFGIVKPSRIDVVLDASGFSYGDQWGSSMAEYRLGSTIKKLKSKGKKVILLPQALGPFDNLETRKTVSKIFDGADLVFARDKRSYDFATSVSSHAHVDLAPDFTNIISGVECDLFDSSLHGTCIIPNSKMIEKTTQGDEYIEFMVNLVRECHANSARPFILVHEGKADRELAELIVSRLSLPIPILEPIDPLKIKWIIGKSKIVISSRFHGLVSALSQGVPVLATGWSHKYQMLLEDYSVPESLFSVEDGLSSAITYFNKLDSDPLFYDETVSVLVTESKRLKLETVEMWNKVFSVVGTE